jgi:cation diffusion facilitator CzcD-associated flavoprotein CzcO
MPDHPFGTKRIPLENGYYEAYNRDNVRLVDLRETPIEAIARSGIRTVDREYPLDVIVYATGFDAGTGAFNRIRIRGESGIEMQDKWRDGPRTFLGLMVSGFPNLFMVNGPQNPAGLCNAGRCIEQNVDWIARVMEHLRTNNLTRIEPTADAENRWTDHVEDAAAGTVLAANRNSWYFGANTPGKARRATIYAAGASNFRQQCESVARRKFVGCTLS